MELEIQKSLVISTGHITKKDDDLLGNLLRTAQLELIIDDEDFGWKVLVDSLFEVGIQKLQDYGFSENFMKCLMLGFIHECTWVLFDADGPMYDFLKTHNW